ncbi:MAG: acetoacetate decarboxylase family protein [Sphingomonadales bacterium]|nr:acetoacetate decarboxylase family protein [Sphingomonadales bacterium]
MSLLPGYVVRPAESVQLQPYVCRSTQLYGFYLRADKVAVQSRLVDPILNAPTDGALNYRCLSDLVLVSYAKAQRCSSTLPPANTMGWMLENSWTLWVPLLLVKSELGIEVAQRLVFYPAYICVDNSWSLAAGREVFGFPKGYGPITVPEPNTPATNFSAATLVIPTYGPDNGGQVLPLMEVRQTGTTSKAGEVWRDIEDAVAAIGHLLSGSGGKLVIPGFNFLLDLVGLAKNEEVPGVFLKQFRDAANGAKACYQAVIEAGSFVDTFHGGGLLDGSYEATLFNYDSHPLAADLGLSPGPQPLEFPFWVNMDFTIGEGREVWRA